MLSHDERRRLRAIEQQLRASDPDLADRLAHGPGPSPAQWAVPVAFVAAFISTFGVGLGLLMPSPALLVPSAVVLVWDWVWLVRSVRRLDSTPTDP